MNSVTFLEFESASARLERTIKRLWIMTIILFAVLVGTNIAWIIKLL